MIGKDKTRLLFTVPKELKERLVKEAEASNRSLNNLIITVLINRDK